MWPRKILESASNIRSVFWKHTFGGRCWEGARKFRAHSRYVVVVWMMENPSEVCGAGNGEERMEVRDVLKGERIRADDRSWGRSTGEVKNDGCLAAN